MNGLAIRSYERDVVAYYREQIIRGPGAFVEEADSFEDFPRAIRRKLIRELTERIIGQVPAGRRAEKDRTPVDPVGRRCNALRRAGAASAPADCSIRRPRGAWSCPERRR